jgi:hypothetical protein
MMMDVLSLSLFHVDLNLVVTIFQSCKVRSRLSKFFTLVTPLQRKGSKTMAGSPTSITEIISRLTKHFTLGSTATSETTLDALQAPPALRAAWSISSEWHQLPSDHYNVFGFNLLSPPTGLSLDNDEKKNGIFGGLDERRQWASASRERDGIDVSCADEGWVVIAAFF